MNVHLTLLSDAFAIPDVEIQHEREIKNLLTQRFQFSNHQLAKSTEEADLILLLGDFGRNAYRLLNNPIYRRHPERCAVYTESDDYLPLVPGVYCSAAADAHTRAGWIFTHSYVSASGRYANPFVSNTERGAKTLLCSFLGGSTSMVRKRLFKTSFGRADIVVENTNAYHHWDTSQRDREDRQRHYAETIAASHFVLCPRGAGTGSIRLFEVMKAGVAPVLLADKYPLPPGIPWNDFLIRIPERDLHRIPEMLESQVGSSDERGKKARQIWLDHFSPEHEVDAIVGLANQALRNGPPTGPALRRHQTLIDMRARFRREVRNVARSFILAAFKVFRRKLPFELNR